MLYTIPLYLQLKVSSVTCRRSVVSSGCSGFLHQKTDFIIISPPWYDPGCCWGVKPLNQTKSVISIPFNCKSIELVVAAYRQGTQSAIVSTLRMRLRGHVSGLSSSFTEPEALHQNLWVDSVPACPWVEAYMFEQFDLNCIWSDIYRDFP